MTDNKSTQDVVRITITATSVEFAQARCKFKVEFHRYMNDMPYIQHCYATVDRTITTLTPYTGASALPGVSENLSRNEEVYTCAKSLLRNYYASIFQQPVHVWI